MFNRQPFNRGRFNRARTDRSVHFFGSVSMAVESAGRVNTVSTLRGVAGVNLNADGKITNIARFTGEANMALSANGLLIRSMPFEGNANLYLTASGQLLRGRNLNGKASIILLTGSGGFNTYRYERLELPKLVMRVGDELIIDTDQMTVTLNGQNVVDLLSRDSEFFLFNPKENDVIYSSGNPNDRVDIRILWKDAFL